MSKPSSASTTPSRSESSSSHAEAETASTPAITVQERRGEGGQDGVVHRPANGLPFLLMMILTVLTAAGLSRVRARAEVLERADEIASLTRTREALLDRKRRLETERAYLRHPRRIREQAGEKLGMVDAPPERIQRIAITAAKDEDKAGR